MTAGTGPAARGWRLQSLLDAPHRLAFSAAALMLALTGGWWGTTLMMAGEGLALRWAMPPTVAHSVLMSLGFMPLFIAGFVFTAGPRWLARPSVRAQALLPSILAMLAGWFVFMLAVHGRDAAYGSSVGALGMAAVALGWAGLIRRFLRMLRDSRAAARAQAKVIAAAVIYGLVAMSVVTVGIWNHDATLVRAATTSALWGFIGLVFAAAAHRLVPFFSAAAWPALDARHPLWLLAALVALFVFKGARSFAEACGWPPGLPVQFATGLLDLLAGAALLALAVRWALVQNIGVRLVAMLYAGFFWLGIALVLSGLSHLPGVRVVLPQGFWLAPLHAFCIGFLGSTLLAMVTRVSCAHSGRAVVADDFLWRLFWVLQLAAMTRVGASLLGEAAALWSAVLITTAAISWAGVCIAWSLRYGPWFGAPAMKGRVF